MTLQRENTALSTCLLTANSQLLIAILKTSGGKVDYKAIADYMGPGKSRLVLPMPFIEKGGVAKAKC